MLYENGEFERIRPHLTPLECGIIFHGIPEGAISRKVGLIWGIPVEQKERMIADAFEVAVIGCALLLTVYWTLRTIHIQDNSLV